MKKAATFRFDTDLLERARRSAAADHRTLTNFVETALLRAIERAESDERSAGQSVSDQRAIVGIEQRAVVE